MGGVSTLPVYRGSYRRNRWIGFPFPDMGWGRDGGTVGGLFAAANGLEMIRVSARIYAAGASL